MFSRFRYSVAMLVLASLMGGCGMESGKLQRAPYDSHASVANGAVEPPALPADVEAFNDALNNDMTSLRYAEAETKLRNVLPRFETSGSRSYSAKTLFWLGYAAEKQQRPAEARQYYNRLIEDYPKADAADQARQRLAGPISPIKPAPKTP